MATVLQPDLHPWTTWQRRGLVIAALIAALAALSIAGRSTNTPPQVLAGLGSPDYLLTVERLIDNADQRVWVMVYVLYGGEDASHPINHLIQRLAAAKQRGIDVRMILDIGTEWDSDVIDPKHEQALKLLQAHHIPVITDEMDRTSHAKVVLVDDRHAVVGSHNWTRSALLRNREVAIHLVDPIAVRELEPLFTQVPGFTELGARATDP